VRYSLADAELSAGVDPNKIKDLGTVLDKAVEVSKTSEIDGLRPG
jgi:hypothetical protein